MAIPVMAVLGGAMMGMGLATMLPPMQRAIAYPMNRGWQNEVIGAAEALELRLREKLSEADTSYHIGSTGLSDANIDLIMELKHQLLDVMGLVTLWRREKLADAELIDKAKHIGWNEEDIVLIKKLTEFIPNAQDVIRFAVREVYTPEIAEAFGQYEGAEEVIANAAKDLNAIGILPETLEKYWAAHWELPSVQMGYEMLHRDVIDDGLLDKLMRALDIMPFWRDKLKAISYSPLTRVDVRRMHKIGVLTEAELVRAYKDIGYNTENAERLKDFTVKYNADPEESEQTGSDKDKAKERDLTKTDILNGFADGLFEESETKEALSLIGYNPNDADYYISRVIYNQDKNMIGKYVGAYRTAYLTNTMTHDEITDALNKLNLSGRRVENLFNIWDIEKSVRTMKPTKAEILMFLRKKIINKDTALSELRGLGYNERYVGWYLQTA